MAGQRGIDRFGIGQPVDLVEDNQGVFAVGFEFANDLFGRDNVFLPLRVAEVDDVDQQVGGFQFFKRGFEGFDDRGGQFPDEADRIGEKDLQLVRQDELARGRIERGEEFVLGEDAGLGQPVEQG